MSKDEIIAIMRAMTPFLEIQPTSDEELLGMWAAMSDKERQMMIDSYNRVDWSND